MMGWQAFQWWLYDQKGQLMARCRVCRSSLDVLSYDPRGLWAYFFRRTWCPAHCPEHDYENDRSLGGFYCQHCGDPAPLDYHGYDYG